MALMDDGPDRSDDKKSGSSEQASAANKVAKPNAPRTKSNSGAKSSKPGQPKRSNSRQKSMLAEEKPVLPPAPPAKIKKRHKALIVSFMVMVVLPIAMLVWYMTTRVVEQFHSELSFSVRKEHSEVPTDFVGSLAQLSGASSSDVDVLYQFIKSQALVLEIDKQFDLRSIYTEHREQDPLFALKENATIEDLVDFWPRMVRIHYDRTTGIIELRVLAFSAETAREIAQAILDYSTNRINKLSAVARADTMRYANEELDLAVQRLTRARQALTQFRLRTQIVDPFVDLQGQMGVMNTLQAELATALIDLGLLRSTANIGDPRVEQGRLRVEVIKDQIAEERAKFGVGGQGPGGEDYASLVAEFERLTVDHEFAAEAYTLALSARDIAQAEAQRQSRYLAAHIEPTLAESSHYPRIVMIISISVAFLILIWATSILIYYSIRDRR